MKCLHKECKKETFGLFAYCKDCLIFMIAHSDKKRDEKHINCDYVKTTHAYCKCICNRKATADNTRFKKERVLDNK